MQDRTAQAVVALKAAKSQGLSYYDATQNLAKQGFNQQEIEQASYQFPYSDASPADVSTPSQSTNADQAFAEGVVHQEALENTKHELHKDIALGLLGGRGIIGSYFETKAVSDYAEYKDLKQNKPEQTTDETPNTSSGTRVYQRHRIVKYYAYMSLLVPFFIIPTILLNFRSSQMGINVLANSSSSGRQLIDGIYIWWITVLLSYIFIASTLFLAKKESSIINSIYIVMALNALLFLGLTLVWKSPIFLILGVLTIVPNYFINKRVGLLSQLS